MSDDGDPALPHAVALAWGLAARPQRPPRGELSTERIVERAIEIADAEGLGAVSMARVASTLGYTTMSLYRYVTSKDDLLQLMQEAAGADALGGPTDDVDELAEGDAVGTPVAHAWRGELRAWILGLVQMHRAHPWLADVPVSGPPLTPNALRVADSGFRSLRGLPLSDEEKVGVILFATNLVAVYARMARDLRAAPPDDHTARALDELVSAEQFPYLRPVLDSGAYVGADSEVETDVAFAIDRVLDGVAGLLDGRHDVPAPEAPAPAEGEEARRAELYRTDKKLRAAAKRRREAEKKLREELKREREILREAERKVVEAERRAAED